MLSQRGFGGCVEIMGMCLVSTIQDSVLNALGMGYWQRRFGGCVEIMGMCRVSMDMEVY